MCNIKYTLITCLLFDAKIELCNLHATDYLQFIYAQLACG